VFETVDGELFDGDTSEFEYTSFEMKQPLSHPEILEGINVHG